jgi:hypothetical protein
MDLELKDVLRSNKVGSFFVVTRFFLLSVLRIKAKAEIQRGAVPQNIVWDASYRLYH